MHVAERCRDAALRRHGMRARRKYLGDAGGAQAGLAAADHRAQASATGADHDDVVAMILDRIGLSVGGGSTTTVCCGLAVAISGHALLPQGAYPTNGTRFRPGYRCPKIFSPGITILLSLKIMCLSVRVKSQHRDAGDDEGRRGDTAEPECL